MPQNLYKSKTNKVIAGVCGGVGEYFNVDATLVRLVWALAFFLGGSGFILYILAMIIMPDDPRAVPTKEAARETAVLPGEGQTEGTGTATAGDTGRGVELNSAAEGKKGGGEEKRNQIFGLVLVAVGAYFLLERYFPFFKMRNWWPLLVILIGLFVIFKGRGGAR